MATTTRKDRKQKPVLKLAEEKPVVVAPEKKEYLELDHLLILETTTRDIENAKLGMALEEQYLRNLLLEQSLLAVKIEKQKVLLREKSNQYETKKQKFVNIKKELWPQYGFKEEEGLSFDPQTGKIVR